MTADIERYLSASTRITTTDLDWAEAARAGLTEDERFVITYFSDIESQTIRYLRSLLGMKIALEPSVTAFLATWNYEEFFHGYELARLLEVCGHPLVANRIEQVKQRGTFKEWLELVLTPLFSRVFYHQFPAVYLSFGAIQEMTTLRGYEHLKQFTQNPVLKTLCDRIAKQERRHFAWYFNHARQQLEQTPGARWLTRRLLESNWVPVGAGVKTTAEVKRLFTTVFPAAARRKVVQEIDAKMGTLPGLAGIRLMEPYFEKAGAL